MVDRMPYRAFNNDKTEAPNIGNIRYEADFDRSKAQESGMYRVVVRLSVTRGQLVTALWANESMRRRRTSRVCMDPLVMVHQSCQGVVLRGRADDEAGKGCGHGRYTVRDVLYSRRLPLAGLPGLPLRDHW